MIKIRDILPEDPLEFEKLKSRFLSHVEKTNNCWEWTGYKRGGYGAFRLNYKNTTAHRVSYTLFKGEIPEGLTLDHLCRNHSCVNPEHLEAVTQKENTLRGIGITAIFSKKTHCPKGHEYIPENIHRYRGNRICKTCVKIRSSTTERKQYMRNYYKISQNKSNT